MSSAKAPGRQTVVLIGGGHAHVQVLRSWAMDPPENARLIVVLDQPVAVYSGMVPGFVAGDYRLPELEIDVVPLARRAGAGVILARAEDLDPVRQEIHLEDRPPIRFDLASVDVGSTVRGLDLPGVRQHALATRPIGHFVRALDAETDRLGHLGRAPRILIAGGGAAGSEIAMTLGARLRARALAPEITLATSESSVLGDAAPALKKKLSQAFRRAGVEVLHQCRVVAVDEKGAVLERSKGATASEGDRLSSETSSSLSSPGHKAADLVIWATGAAATRFAQPENAQASSPPAEAASPNAAARPRGGRLALDPRGFIEVRDTLQAVGFDAVFAVGDCARLVDHPWVPRAGVYAVRQGPILDHNLRAALRRRKLIRYRPQRDFLSLLHLGERKALGAKWGLAFAGTAIFRLKDAIDRRFMSRFQVLTETGAPRPELAELGAMDTDEDGEEMACGGCAAKLGALPLEAALAQLPAAEQDASVLLGLEARDDVAATRSPSGEIALHNIDVIRAFCDDPYLVGRVAASNALSDLYAKGGVPTHAQAVLGVPEDEPAISQEMLYQALAGLRRTLDEADVSLLGGHTTLGDDLTVGLSVVGTGLSESALLRQAGAQVGDQLLMTQPIGTGVVLAADMQGLARGEWVREAHDWMQRTNAVAGQIAREAPVHAATDITGFGLAGHCLSLLESLDLTARLDRDAIWCLPGARSLWAGGLRSTAHPQNQAAFQRRVLSENKTEAETEADAAWLFDPQTAGGLLLSVAPEAVQGLIADFRQRGEPEPVVIGHLEARAAQHPAAGARGTIVVERRRSATDGRSAGS